MYKLNIKNITLYVSAESDRAALVIAKIVKATSVQCRIATERVNGRLITKYRLVSGAPV